MLLHIGATRRIRLNTLMLSCVAVVTRDVVVNFYFWERFPRPRSQQRGRLRPHARRVAVLGVSAGRGRPLPLRRSGVSPPENFGRFLMPNPAFGGNLGQKIKLIEGQPNEYDVICRNASVLAFHLWPTIFAGAPFRLQNICRNCVPARSRTTTPLRVGLCASIKPEVHNVLQRPTARTDGRCGKQNLLLFIQPRWHPGTYFFNHCNVSFLMNYLHSPFKSDTDGTQILGFILICLSFTTGHFHTCTGTLHRMQLYHISF